VASEKHADAPTSPFLKWLGAAAAIGIVRTLRAYLDAHPLKEPSTEVQVARVEAAGALGQGEKAWMFEHQDHPERQGQSAGQARRRQVHFTEGPLDGLKLIGFSIWERRGGNGRNVTFPARQYTVNGERRAFALLRPIVDVAAQTRVRDLILDAYQQYEERAAAL
jgi:hypothetical protein